jgi:hypothetical protein
MITWEAIDHYDPAQAAIDAEDGGIEGPAVSPEAETFRALLVWGLSAGIAPVAVASQIARAMAWAWGDWHAARHLARHWGNLSLQKWTREQTGHSLWRAMRLRPSACERELRLLSRECQMRAGVIPAWIRTDITLDDGLTALCRTTVATLVTALCRRNDRENLGPRGCAERWLIAAWKLEEIRREYMGGIDQARLAGILGTSRARVNIIAQSFQIHSPGEARAEVRAATAERRQGNKSRLTGLERNRLASLITEVKI